MRVTVENVNHIRVSLRYKDDVTLRIKRGRSDRENLNPTANSHMYFRRFWVRRPFQSTGLS